MGNWSAERSPGMLEELLGSPCPTHGDVHAADDCPLPYASKPQRDGGVGFEPGDAPEVRGRLTDYDAVRQFILAGNAVFTLVSKRTGTRFTYKIQVPEEERPGDSVHFVKVLNGPDNWTNYAFLGTIFAGRRFVVSRKARISAEAPSAKAITWFLNQLDQRGPALNEVEFYHEGRCGRCGRRLTVPESITTGFGPECAGKMGVR